MKKYTRFKSDMVNCKEEYTDKEEYNMKKYVKSAVNVHNIKQTPNLDEFIEKYFTDLFGLNGNTSSNNYWFSYYAAIKGGDVIFFSFDYIDMGFCIAKNAAKYLDEFFAVNSEEEWKVFRNAHPDVTEEWTTNILDILD